MTLICGRLGLAAGILLLWTSFGSAQSRIPWTSNRVIGSPNPPAPYAVSRRYSQLNFNNPVDLAFMPESKVLFVAEQSGKIWTADTASTSAPRRLALDWRQYHEPLDSVLGFTFHPGFATNRFVYLNYNEPAGRPLGSRVSRFTVSAQGPLTLDPASEQIIIQWPSGGHNGCTLAFGKDGMLYISTGDQADPDPPDDKAKTGQDISDLLASVLRIDVDHVSGTNRYSIPSDNPFIKTSGARPEVYAFGFRNPYRMSFDGVSGDLWVGDVGWEQWEMVYRVVRGGNYGWSLVEGPNPNVRKDIKPGPGPILPPMVSLPHSEAASITGGQVYRGKKLPELHGAYLYGDWETGKFWALRNDGDRLIRNDELCDTTLKPVSFVLDPDGELLILDYGGGLYELVTNSAQGANKAFPKRLSETGLFSRLNPLEASSGVIGYRPTATLWSDHAIATHHLAVPYEGSIVTTNARQTIAGGMWHVPTNTVFARTLTLAEGTAEQRRVETQLLHFDGQAWNPYTFRWNSQQTDADLVPSEGASMTLETTEARPVDGTHPSIWRFQSRTECLRCHNSWAGETLSFTWLQLSEKERRRLAQLGVLEVKDPPQDLKGLVAKEDPQASVEDHARTWLHVNCAGCHRFGAGGAVAIHLNFDKAFREWRALDQKPTRGDFGLADAQIIASGDPYRSALVYRISTEGAGHMPQIGSRLVDEAGVRWVSDWIRSIEPQTAPPASPSQRTAIEDALKRSDHAFLLSSVSGSLALANTLRARGPVKPPESALTHSNRMIAELFQRFLPASQRRQTLGDPIQPAVILSLVGNSGRGMEVFSGVGQCARCHMHAGAGKAFGPDLKDIRRKYSRAQILDQILHPSLVVAPEYKTHTVTLKDGSELAGFVLKRASNELLLRDASAVDHILRTSDIETSRESMLSAMPEGLMASLTAQEAADLLEFLQ